MNSTSVIEIPNYSLWEIALEVTSDPCGLFGVGSKRIVYVELRNYQKQDADLLSEGDSIIVALPELGPRTTLGPYVFTLRDFAFISPTLRLAWSGFGRTVEHLQGQMVMTFTSSLSASVVHSAMYAASGGAERQICPVREEDSSASRKRPPGSQTFAVETATVMFTDIVDSTVLTESMGDEAFRSNARRLDERLRTEIRRYRGTPIEGKLLGDGVMAIFKSAKEAILAGLACASVAEESKFPLHVGLHTGDATRDGDNVYGGAVNLAARIAGQSKPGEVLVSNTVREVARTSANVLFDDRGEHDLKGIGEPQRLFAVRVR